MNRAVFIDRDGVINRRAKPHSYITKPEEFEILPGALEAISILSRTNYKLIIPTNQRGIARGILSKKQLDAIHQTMLKEIKQAGGRIDKIYVCPHNYDECNCRKPLPGMLEQAKADFNLDLENSWVIGDLEGDIQFGKSRNCRTIYLGDNQEIIKQEKPDYTASNLLQAVSIIMPFASP